MKAVKRFLGLLKENLKSKLWMIVAVWYVFSMFCLLFSTKMTIPTGEIRSLYVGAGNTSFFAGMLFFGVLMGAGSFRYLYSQQKADLFLSLPFSRKQLFAAEYINNIFIFSGALIFCKILFFSISVSMGYSQYEDSLFSVLAGCAILLLGYLLVMNLTILARFLAQNWGYTVFLLVLFFFGPAAGMGVMEKMFRLFIPSFYYSETLEMLKGCLSPFTLLGNAAGIRDFADGAAWQIKEHLFYVFFLAFLVVVLLIINFFVFQIRPVERKRNMFTFMPVCLLIRYGCMLLAVLWLICALQVFSFGLFKTLLVLTVNLFGLPIMNGLLNILISFYEKKFISAKWHLLAETIVVTIVVVIFAAGGKKEGTFPSEDQVDAMAVVLTALQSGGDSSQVLLNMKLTGEELERAYEWVNTNCMEENGDFEILVRFDLKNGREKYCKYQIPWPALYGFEEIFSGKEFKEGCYEGICLDSLKYYEVRWTNGVESYTLDLNEEERQELLEVYKEDFDDLTFSDIRTYTPVGRFDFVSTKNQGDVSGYIYPEFIKVQELLEKYGIDGTRSISQYKITKIVVDKYMLTQGLLYHWNSLEWEKTFTDEEYIKELSKVLYFEDFCEDYLLNEKNPDMEFTVYYKDSGGKTVNRVKCRALADPAGNEALKSLL